MTEILIAALVGLAIGAIFVLALAVVLDYFDLRM
jgi:hypothetical protein